MPVSLRCQGCKSTLKVPDHFAGKKVKCPKCATVLAVPAAEEELAPVEVVPEQRISTKPRKPAVSRRDEEDDEGDRDRDRRVRPGRDRDRDERRTSVREENDQDRDRKRRRSRDEDEEGDDRRDRKDKDPYKPCPKCGAGKAKRVLWTPWGSFYGPAMFTHVRCPECGYKYNGKTGRSNLIPAIVLVTVPLIGILAIIGAILYILMVRNYIPKFW